jgi:hypothetical protein
MRLVYIASVTTLLALASCGRSDLENRAAEADAEKAKREATENQLAVAMEQRNEAEARAERFQAAANTITKLELDVTLHCAASGEGIGETAAKIMGGLDLVQSNGSSWSMSETTDGSTSDISTGTCRISLQYLPDTPSEVIGQPITALQNVQSLSAPYERLLNKAGASLSAGGTADVRVVVNNVEVVSVPGLPVSSTSDGMSTVAVGESFSRIFDNYTNAVQQRNMPG